VIGTFGRDDDIVEAIAVDVDVAGNGAAAAVIGRFAVDGEAVGPVEIGEIDAGAEAALAAEHDIGRSVLIVIGKGIANDEIVDPVSVDIAGASDAGLTGVEGGPRDDREAASAVEAAQRQV